MNKHVKGSGSPPYISNVDSKDYFGYFENEHGEQWVFTYDRKSQKGELRGGDVGWDNIYQVSNGQVELILNSEERKWLQACWEAVTAFDRFKSQNFS